EVGRGVAGGACPDLERRMGRRACRAGRGATCARPRRHATTARRPMSIHSLPVGGAVQSLADAARKAAHRLAEQLGSTVVQTARCAHRAGAPWPTRAAKDREKAEGWSYALARIAPDSRRPDWIGGIAHISDHGRRC